MDILITDPYAQAKQIIELQKLVQSLQARLAALESKVN